MSNKSFDHSNSAHPQSRNDGLSRPQSQVPRLKTQDIQQSTGEAFTVHQACGNNVAQVDQEGAIFIRKSVEFVVPPPCSDGNEEATDQGSKPHQDDQEAQKSEHSTASSGGNGSSGQFLVPPENFRMCDGEDIDTLMVENDRLRYIIQTLNSNWQTSGPMLKINKLRDQIADLLKDLDLSKLENQKLKAEIERLKTQSATKDQMVESLKANLHRCDSVIAKQTTIKEKQDRHIEKLNKDLVKIEKETKKYKNQLSAKTKEHEKLMTTYGTYIGHKDDEIDQAMAKAINEYPEKEKLQILFLRESEGVYKFGSRQVYVKMGTNREVRIKVGGGYLSMKSFIEQFTEVEKQKLQRDDVASRFSNKLKIQQICSDLASNRNESISINTSQIVRAPEFEKQKLQRDDVTSEKQKLHRDDETSQNSNKQKVQKLCTDVISSKKESSFISNSQIARTPESEKRKLQNDYVTSRNNNKLKAQKLSTDVTSNKNDSISIYNNQIVRTRSDLKTFKPIGRSVPVNSMLTAPREKETIGTLDAC